LKQGLYDYIYVAEQTGQPLNESLYEGNHHETEHTYFIFVYLHNQSGRLDQLIGFASQKSP
jgi:hypothetical protein